MNHESRSSNGGAIVAALLLLALIVLVGAGVGFFFVGSSQTTTVFPMSSGPVASVVADPILITPPAEVLATFPLATLDIKDTLEAPTLAIDAQGDLLLAFASQTKADERTLYLAQTTKADGYAFAQPVQPRELRRTAIYTSVSQMRGKEVKRALRLVPHLATSGERVLLSWMEPNADNTTVFYQVAESTDGGATFGEPLRMHASDGARPTFTALNADAQGNVAASWLDNRAGIQQPFASVRLAGEAAFNTESQVYASPEDKGVCPCCPTASLITPDGRLIVAFRNQLAGFRDIYVVERKLTGDEGFGEPQRVLADPTWTFDGCPHDGPSLATDGTTLFVGWMDAHTGSPRCYVASRPLAGGAFTSPEQLPGDPAGCLQLAMDSSGTLHAVWEVTVADLEVASQPATADAAPAQEEAAAKEEAGHKHGAPTGSSKAIYYAQRNQEGWNEAVPLAPREGAFQSRATLVIAPSSQVIVAWNELDEQGKRVVVAKVNASHSFRRSTTTRDVTPITVPPASEDSLRAEEDASR